MRGRFAMCTSATPDEHPFLRNGMRQRIHRIASVQKVAIAARDDVRRNPGTANQSPRDQRVKKIIVRVVWHDDEQIPVTLWPSIPTRTAAEQPDL